MFQRDRGQAATLKSVLTGTSIFMKFNNSPKALASIVSGPTGLGNYTFLTREFAMQRTTVYAGAKGQSSKRLSNTLKTIEFCLSVIHGFLSNCSVHTPLQRATKIWIISPLALFERAKSGIKLIIHAIAQPSHG
jgi:hypothetical protein